MKKEKIFSFCNIYIILWLVYSLQSMVFGRVGTIYSQVIILFLTVVSIYYMFFALIHYKLNPYLKVLTIFIALLTVYGVVLLMGSNSLSTHKAIKSVSSYSYLLGLYNSLLPLYPFYVFTRQGDLTRTSLRWGTLLFLVVVLLQYNLNHQAALLRALEAGSDRDEFTNNVGYEFLAIIPLLAFFSDKKVIQYAGLTYVMVFLLLSMKRGAILIGAICLVYFLWNSMRGTKGNRKLFVVVLSVAVIVVGYYAVMDLLRNSDYFMYRLEVTQEGGTSGRYDIYSLFFNHFINESDLFELLFGNGAYGTLKVYQQAAHNDWLELAFNQGLLGVVVYLFYWFKFYKTVRTARFNEEIHLSIKLLFIIFLLRTFFSMSYGDMSIYATSCLGYCLGRISENEAKMSTYRTVAS